MHKLFTLVNQFDVDGQAASIEPFGSGHINDSYLVKTSPVSAPDYVLQRINHLVFPNVAALTENILRVTGHIRGRLNNEPERFREFRIFNLARCRTGGFIVTDEERQFWRLLDHIRGSRSYDTAESPEIALEAGKAFGTFQDLTADADAGSLVEILPHFHDIRTRLSNFRQTLAMDPVCRADEASQEILFIEARAAEMHHIAELGEAGKIPLRVTHNDTKINNVLFNDDNKAISVVDLDTVMPGYSLYDFGDAIRTGACACAEDEADLQKAHLDLSLFSAYTRGYLQAAGHLLTPGETGSLAFSAKFMTYIIGLRFLTDHLDGDRYFKIRFPGHNLRRARVQFRLLQSMEQHFVEMKTIVRGSAQNRLQ